MAIEHSRHLAKEHWQVMYTKWLLIVGPEPTINEHGRLGADWDAWCEELMALCRETTDPHFHRKRYAEFIRQEKALYELSRWESE